MHVQSAKTLVESCFLCVNGAMIALETTSSLLVAEDDVEVVSTGNGLSRFLSLALLEEAMSAARGIPSELLPAGQQDRVYLVVQKEC